MRGGAPVGALGPPLRKRDGTSAQDGQATGRRGSSRLGGGRGGAGWRRVPWLRRLWLELHRGRCAAVRPFAINRVSVEYSAVTSSSPERTALHPG